jgi:hypothetical protein
MTTKLTPAQATIASTAEAEAGTATDKFMTPERVAEAITALSQVSPFTASYTSGELSVATQASHTLTHSLGDRPVLVQARLVCKVANAGCSVGDEVVINIAGDSSSTERCNSVRLTTTQILIKIANNALLVTRPDNGAVDAITATSWRMVIRAWA